MIFNEKGDQNIDKLDNFKNWFNKLVEKIAHVIYKSCMIDVCEARNKTCKDNEYFPELVIWIRYWNDILIEHANVSILVLDEHRFH